MWGFVCCVVVAGAPAVDFTVTAYDVTLEIDREQKLVAGRERVSVRSASDGLAALAFPSNGITVLSAATDAGTALRYETTPNGSIRIQLPSTLARGRSASVVMHYQTTAPKGIAFKADAVYSAFHTCHWMLCRDQPGEKAPLMFSIVAPIGIGVVASGVPMGTKDLDGGRRRHLWKESVPSSAYLYGFALGAFQKTTRKHRGTTFDYYAAMLDDTRRERAFADDGRMLDFFSAKAGVRLPRRFYRQVVVDGGVAQEMSSFAVVGRDLVDARIADATEDWFVAHELAHQFWGNLVTCADWTHFWLNEGVTTFMVAAYKEERWGRAAYERELTLARERLKSAADSGMNVPLTFAGDYPSPKIKRAITYSKAMLFLDRLRTTMGEQAFWRALKSYTRRFAGRAVVSQDFQRAFAAETDKDLSGLFAQWVW
jgi:aminopeptidase N